MDWAIYFVALTTLQIETTLLSAQKLKIIISSY